jgi:hypothetical protein
MKMRTHAAFFPKLFPSEFREGSLGKFAAYVRKRPQLTFMSTPRPEYDEPRRKTVWVFSPADEREVEALVAAGWKLVHRLDFNGRQRVELSSRPSPAAPPAGPENHGERCRRNISHAGPKGAFVRGHKTRAWSE